MNTAFLNNEFLPLEDAKLPVLDRGFLFADGVYEVIPVYAGRLLRLDHHLDRLDNSMQGIRITNPMSRAEWKQALQKLVELNGLGDQSIYLQVTRGVSDKRNHLFPEKSVPSVFMMSSPLGKVDPILLQQGAAVITLDDIRWQYCDYKTIALLPNVLLRQQAQDANADEAILVRDGLATECSASNLFVVQQGVIITPPKSHHLLPGITRDLILELANENKLPYKEADIKVGDLSSVDEIWFTSSSKEIVPITKLNDQTVGTGKPGPVWEKMLAIYHGYVNRLRQGLVEV